MKYKNISKLATAALALLLSGTSSQAAPVESNNIDAAAKWLIHIDFDSLLDTEIAQHVLDQNPKLSDQKLEALKNIIGIDFKTGLHGATIYGNGQPDNGVLILHADAKPDVLINFAKLNDEYREEKFQDHIIHNLPDDKKPGKRNYICFYTNKKIVIGPSSTLVKECIQLLNGDRDSKPVNHEMEELNRYQPSPFLIAYGDFSALHKEGNHNKAATFKQAKRMGLSIGEHGGNIKSILVITAKNIEVATQIENFLRGIIAIGQLSGEKHPHLATLANAAKISKKDPEIIAIETELPTSTLISVGHAMKEHKKKKMERAGLNDAGKSEGKKKKNRKRKQQSEENSE